jgi:hypothetical protein
MVGEGSIVSSTSTYVTKPKMPKQILQKHIHRCYLIKHRLDIKLFFDIGNALSPEETHLGQLEDECLIGIVKCCASKLLR